MYCVYQINESHGEKIVKIVKSKDEFLNSIKIENCNIISDITIKQLKNNINIDSGFYILNNPEQIQLVEKQNIMSKGYIYNSACINIKLLSTWRMIPFDMNYNVLELIEPNENENDNNQTTGEEESILPQFDFTNVGIDTSNIIIGDVHSGKNLLVGKLVDDKLKTPYNFDILVVSKKPNLFYKARYPNVDISYGNDATIINNYITMRLIKMKDEIYNSKGIVILDDCEFINNNDNIKHLIYNYWHYGVTLIVTVPFDHELKPEFRVSFNNVFLLHIPILEAQLKMYNMYGDNIKSFDAFKECYGNTGIVLNNKNVYCLKNY
jgi:hypothetical protein